MTEAEAEKIAEAALKEAAENYLVNLIELHASALPGNQEPAETILLAHLMASTDGYNKIELHSGDWEKRPHKSFGTVLGYFVPLGQAIATFLLECRCDGHIRELAVVVDATRQNVRTVEKRTREAALAATCSVVMTFTASEIEHDPAGCAERICSQVTDLIDETLADAGHIKGRSCSIAD